GPGRGRRRPDQRGRTHRAVRTRPVRRAAPGAPARLTGVRGHPAGARARSPHPPPTVGSMWVMIPPTRVPAQLRGALVGALSVVISLAAHGSALHRSHPAGHGHHDPAATHSGAPAAAAIGALPLPARLPGLLVVRTTRRRAGPVALAGLLIAGQIAGHLALSVGAAEAGHPLMPSAAMLLWHGAAVLAGAAVILSAEAAAAGAATVRAAVRA